MIVAPSTRYATHDVCLTCQYRHTHKSSDRKIILILHDELRAAAEEAKDLEDLFAEQGGDGQL